MTAILLIIGAIASVLLFQILRLLQDIHETVASIYVHGSLKDEHALRESQAAGANEVLEGKKLLYSSPMSAVNEIRFERDRVNQHFAEVGAKIAARRPATEPGVRQ